ncbi:MAG: MerR family transcriptional regulator [Defluviitaleaceae bacterium]|nr:MerR family transcriptional regulator [Defluviitaleaceae bacterium]
MHNSYYQIGEFAKICGVARSTLLYYAKIKLFEPDHIGENGYFYYSPSQIFMFESIITLRDMKVPLEEIKEYLSLQSPNRCMEVLEKNLKIVVERRMHLEKLEGLISSTLHETTEALKEECDKFEIIKLEKDEAYFVYLMPYRTENCTFDLKEARKLINYCKANFYNDTLRVTEFVLPEDVSNDTFKKTYGAFKLHDKNAKAQIGKNTFIRPAGYYATVAKYSNGEGIPEIYRELRDFAKQQNHHTCGIAFEKDLLSHMMHRDRANYLLRCYLQVSPN